MAGRKSVASKSRTVTRARKSNPRAGEDEVGGWKVSINADTDSGAAKISLPLGGGSYAFNRAASADGKGTLRRTIGYEQGGDRVIIRETHREDGVVIGYTAVAKRDGGDEEVVGTARISRGGVAPGAKKKLPGAGAGAALSNPRPSRRASVTKKNPMPARNSKGQFVKNPKRRSR